MPSTIHIHFTHTLKYQTKECYEFNFISAEIKFQSYDNSNYRYTSIMCTSSAQNYFSISLSLLLMLLQHL